MNEDDDWGCWEVREPNSTFDPTQRYVNDRTDYFTLEFHHGGQFSDFPEVNYEGGKVSYIDKVNVDLFSVIIVNDMLASLGYSEDDVVSYHFRIPGEDLVLGLRPLGNDKDSLSLTGYAANNKVMEIYVQHLQTFPNMVDSQDRDDLGNVTQEPTVVDLSDNEESQESEGSGTDDSDEDSEDSDESSRDSEVKKDDSVDKDPDYRAEEDPDYMEDEDNTVENFEVNDMNEFRALVEYEGDANPLDETDGEEQPENEVDQDDFDSQSDSDMDTPLEQVMRKVRKQKRKTQLSLDDPFFVSQGFTNKEEMGDLVRAHAVHTRRQLNISKNDPFRFRVVCLGGNIILGSCESKGDGTNVGENLTKGKGKGKDKGKGKGKAHGGDHAEKVNANKEAAGESNNEQVDKEGKDVKAPPKLRKTQLKPTCPWRLHISHKKKKELWVVKTYVKEHTCLQTRVVDLCTVTWLAKQIEPTIRSNPTIPVKSLQEDLQKKYQIQVSANQVFRAKGMAKKKIEGDYEAQYQQLRDYAEELLRADPRSTVKIDVEPFGNPNSETRQFRRIYICLGALKSGFKAGMREILCLDGCFLKGPFPGQILTAVGIDGNSGIYPVAYSLVEAETTQTWSWFLQLLGDDLEIGPNSSFTFMSDRQKGIIPAIARIYPHAEHRHCLKHIHDNIRGTWKGQIFKDLLWTCATATTTQAFESAMLKVKDENKDLHEYLRNIQPKHWSRAYFTGKAKSDLLLNNHCEVFNKQLVQGRDKPIITCLEFIREYLMKRLVIVHKIIAKCNGPLTPNAAKKFDDIKKDAGSCNVIWCGPSKYQVSGPHIIEQRVVNIDQRSCSCRRWDLTGMPCRHAVACIWNMRLNGIGDGIPEKFVDRAYWLDTWKAIYAHTIEPINGMDMWPKSQCPTTLINPKFHKQSGRPKKKRKKSAAEIEDLKNKVQSDPKLPRKDNSLTCGLCKGKGHNRRTCKSGGGNVKQSGAGSSTGPSVAGSSTGTSGV